MSGEATQVLAQFAASLKYEDLPDHAREQCKNLTNGDPHASNRGLSAANAREGGDSLNIHERILDHCRSQVTPAQDSSSPGESPAFF